MQKRQILHSKEPTNTTQAHIVGIDVLRVVAIFLVILTHLLTHGGLFGASRGSGRIILRVLFSYTPQGVDLFILASGFLLYEKQFRLRRIAVLVLEVIFWAVFVSLGIRFFFPVDFDWLTILSDYWFFNRYLFLAAFVPILNGGLESVNKKSLPEVVWLNVFLLGMSLFFLPLQPKADSSIAWFLVLYLLGAQTKVCLVQSRVFREMPPNRFLFVGIVLPLITIVVCHVLRFAGLSAFSLLESKASPLVCLSSVCLFSWFVRLRSIPFPFFFRFLASGAFGVYLIHDHVLARNLLLKGRTASFSSLPPSAMIVALLGTAVSIFLFCSLLDAGRRWFFRRLRIG